MSSAAAAVRLDGDVVPIADTKAVSAMEKFYRLKLMQEQIVGTKDEAGNVIDEDKAKEIISNTSELDSIILKCFMKIRAFKESSPQWAQIYTITGKRDPWEQAEVIGSQLYEQQRSEVLMSYYAPDKSSVRQTFLDNAKAANEAQGTIISELISKRGTASAIASLVTGGSSGGSSGVVRRT